MRANNHVIARRAVLEVVWRWDGGTFAQQRYCVRCVRAVLTSRTFRRIATGEQHDAR